MAFRGLSTLDRYDSPSLYDQNKIQTHDSRINLTTGPFCTPLEPTNISILSFLNQVGTYRPMFDLRLYTGNAHPAMYQTLRSFRGLW